MTEDKKNKETDQILKTASDDKKTLEAQINNIITRQQELQNYIVTLETSIQQLEMASNTEQSKPQPDYGKIAKLRGAITRNIEMINMLYNTYKSFEDVKFKYHQQITNNNISYIKMIEVDIKRAQSKDTITDRKFMAMMEALTGVLTNKDTKKSFVEECEKELNDPLYEV